MVDYTESHAYLRLMDIARGGIDEMKHAKAANKEGQAESARMHLKNAKRDLADLQHAIGLMKKGELSKDADLLKMKKSLKLRITFFEKKLAAAEAPQQEQPIAPAPIPPIVTAPTPAIPPVKAMKAEREPNFFSLLIHQFSQWFLKKKFYVDGPGVVITRCEADGARVRELLKRKENPATANKDYISWREVFTVERLETRAPAPARRPSFFGLFGHRAPASERQSLQFRPVQCAIG